MTRRLGWFAAACIGLASLAGCTLDSFTLNAFTADGNGPVVAASLDVVSASAQKALSNVFVSVYRNKDVIKMTSTTPDGKRFTLILKGRKTDHGDETQLTIHWEKDADNAFWLQLAESIANPSSAAPNPVTAGDALPRNTTPSR